MIKPVTNEKGFLILLVDREDMAIMLDSPGVCDHCNQMPETGYLVAVLNHWLCPKCTKEFLERAVRYDEDIPIEKRNHEYYLHMAKMTNIEVVESVTIESSLNT